MYLLYEEDGEFKAGTLVADNDSSLQIDSQFGKRIKLRAAQVILRFVAPPPAEFMQAVNAVRADLDVDFLWEVAGDAEFSYEDLARDYFGHAPSATEMAGVLQLLHASPMYFYRKGRGHYKPAPAEALLAAKAGVLRRQKEAEQLAAWVAELTQFRLPDELQPEVMGLLFAPDKQKLPWKAVETAAHNTGLTVLRLLARCGAIPSEHDYHYQRFVHEHFPRGIDFPALPELVLPDDLPLAEVEAFSIDDESTTEIDDAFSVRQLDDGSWQVGIHIAVPALGILPDSPLDKVARNRLSTVYYPGGKVTMLPDDVVARFSLDEGRACPALSMYLVVEDISWKVLSERTVLERVPVAQNLRHEVLQHDFNERSLADGTGEYRWQRELEMLWRLSGALEAGRGKTPDPAQPVRADYVFRVEDGRVSIIDRQRGNPVDRLVSELMIRVNAGWGSWLAKHDIAGLYRTQENGKVKMSTRPGPHVGLGVENYAWSSSPLRRYVDLVNQRQILALLHDEPAVYPPRSDTLYAILRDFELAYDAYNEFQRRMERFWCLRWLVQENVQRIGAQVIKENLVRVAGMPLVARVPSMPELPVGTLIEVMVGEMDMLEVDVQLTYCAAADNVG